MLAPLDCFGGAIRPPDCGRAGRGDDLSLALAKETDGGPRAGDRAEAPLGWSAMIVSESVAILTGTTLPKIMDEHSTIP